MSHYQQGYTCRCCGNYHNELPMSYGRPVPDYCYEIPLEEQEERIEMNEDLCIIDEEYFFVRGCIEIPVVDGEGPFIWDVWVSLSENNFHQTIDYWETEGREQKLEPMFGWLSTALPCYPETINLKTRVHTRPVGFSPSIELEPTEHLLAVEQREGIMVERIKQMAEELCMAE
ncbi:DUF2199 domain-containing protein [Pseudobacillus badius]|uniref:DUF2199 domain-containing protein n=1 Tax=Bacillus badius TaxID=1455 RepID=UPI0007B0B03A|nr:DUF2199 domain-containing protein [Bacillus badius]KZN99719.1 hypothetical protein A4244_17125 [Bacillus badius]OCS85823.1 hypothetical protein A6M11_17140 [Bacillus badius]OVE51819.1 DUF2199 domain-containing protein [Bacillus badius]TDW03245.1 hypothetical protein B0G66_104150 [Bacillus badius]